MTDIKTIAEAATAFEEAKAQSETALRALNIAQAVHDAAVARQKAAYRDMNNAIDAIRPKRKVKAVPTPTPAPLEEAIAQRQPMVA